MSVSFSFSFSVSVLLSAFALDACVRVCVLPVVILCVVALAILHFFNEIRLEQCVKNDTKIS